MIKKIKITKCLFPIEVENYVGVPMPKLDGFNCITYQDIVINGNRHEQFEYIPSDLDLSRTDTYREGEYICKDVPFLFI